MRSPMKGRIIKALLTTSISTLPVIAAFALLGATQARAATCAVSPSTCDPYVVTIQQVGSDVVAASNAGGEFNLSGLMLPSQSLGAAGVQAESSILSLADGTGNTFSGASGPIDFGPGQNGIGGFLFASSSSGPVVGIGGEAGFVTVPVGYTSGTPLGISQDIFANATFAIVGVTTGHYEWTWGTGADQSFTLDVVAPVGATPLPATLPLFATGLGALGLLGWRRKRKARVSLLGVG